MNKTEAEHNCALPGYTNSTVQVGLDQLYISLLANLQNVSKICDLGCGNGRLAHAMAKLGFKVLGVDSWQDGITVATRTGGSDTARFICAEIGEPLSKRLVETEGLFDVVVSSDVIEHLYRPRTLVDVAWRILAPGGYLIVGTPYHGYLKNLALSLIDKWDDHHAVAWDGGHIKFLSVRTLKKLMRRGICSAEIQCFRPRALSVEEHDLRRAEIRHGIVRSSNPVSEQWHRDVAGTERFGHGVYFERGDPSPGLLNDAQLVRRCHCHRLV